MNWVFAIAVFFIAWWVTLFAVLPFGLKTQDEDGEVTPGTVKSAPRGAHMLRAMVLTTIITLVLFAIWYVASAYFGLSFDDIPRIVPKFE